MFLSNLFIDPIVNLLQWDWLAKITLGSIIVRLLLSVLCGGIIGVERASKQHAAGFRTYILVALGSAIVGATNQYIIEFFGNGDGARLGAAVVTGIGFLCTGSILVTSRNQIKGLTTAAGIWTCSAIGLAIGLGYYSIAVIGEFITILVLLFFHKFESHFTDRTRLFVIHIELHSRPNLKELITYLRESNYSILNVEHNPAYSESGLSVYSIVLSAKKGQKKKHKEFIDDIGKLEYVNYVEIIDQ